MRIRFLMSLVGSMLVACACRAQGPPPILRVQLPPERLAEEMERLRRPALTQMTREQFEELVARAARAELRGQTPPRLAETRYRVSLSGDGLAGSAEWKVAHADSEPGRLPLGPMAFAIRSAKWTDGAEVILGSLDDRPGSGPELLVNRAGERTLALEWSVRGLAEPGQLRFDLRLPPSSVCVLEFELPADHVLTADRESGALSGPLPAARPDQRKWRLSLARAGGTILAARFAIHRPAAADRPPPLLLTSLQTTQRLVRGQVECEYAFDAQAQRGELPELILECDPSLRPYEIEAPGLDGWSVRPAKGGPTLIDIRLREPFRGGRITLRALSPLLPPGERWTSPGVRLSGSLSSGERLTLLVHPDFTLHDWKPGGFRPIAPSATESGNSRLITLQSREIGTDIGVRPSAQVRSSTGTFQTREAWEWRIERDSTSLTVETQLIPRRGTIAQSIWQIPPGWEIEQIEMRPSDPGLRVTHQPAVGTTPAQVVVDPSQPFTGDDGLLRRLILRLRGARPKWNATPDGESLEMALPALRPRGDSGREGTLTLRLDTNLSTVASTLRPDSTQMFRGEPEAMVKLRRQRARLQARADAEVVVSHQRLRASHQLLLTPSAGAGRDVLLYSSAPVTFQSWRTLQGTAQVRTLRPTRMPAAAMGPLLTPMTSGWQAVGMWPWWRTAGGRWFQLSLDRAPVGPVLIELQSEAALAGDVADVPLLSIVGADRAEGRVVVRTAGAAWPSQSLGLEQEPELEGEQGWSRRAFGYAAPPCLLTLHRPTTAASPIGGQAGPALLLTRLTSGGRQHHLFRVVVSGWQSGELPVTLPEDARLGTIRIDGAALTSQNGRDDDAGVIRIPWDPSRMSVTVELSYETSGVATGGLARVTSPIPNLPFPVQVHRVWRLPAGWAPVSWSAWVQLPGGRTMGLRTMTPLREADAAWSQITTAVIAGEEETFGAWLERVAKNQRDTMGALVIDGIALAGYASRRMTSVKDVVPIRMTDGILLTTRQQAESWGDFAPRALINAISAAAAEGRDSSGRFVHIAEWRAGAATRGEPTWLIDGEWSDWEPMADDSPAVLWVASWWATLVVGLAVAGALIVAVAASRRLRVPLLAASLVAGGLATIWLPMTLWSATLPSFITGLALSIVGVAVRFLRRRGTAMPRSAPAAVITVGLIIALTAGAGGPAAPPTPVTVYLVPSERPGVDNVLAPPDLITSLKSAALRGEPTIAATLLRARYDGIAEGNVIRWTARFRALAFGPGPGSLTLALPDVQMLGATVDGRDAFPRPAESGRFTLDLGAAGAHDVVLRFVTAIAAEGDRDLHFAIPELLDSACSVTFPAGSTDVQMLTARGIQRVQTTGSAVRLDADLGRTASIHLRWRPPGAAAARRVPVQAIHFWDLSEAQSRLRSVFRIQFGSASARGLDIEVPPELELASVSLRYVDDPLGLVGLVGLKDWRQNVSAGRKQHRIEFQIPMTGQVQVELELVDRRPPAATVLLQEPAMAGPFNLESTTAVRVRDLSALVADDPGWERLRPDDVRRSIGLAIRTDPQDREPILAFRRVRGSTAALKVALSIPVRTSTGEVRAAWTLGPDRSDLQATMAWTEAAVSGPLECEVPAEVQLVEVRGDGVQSWTRSGSRLQVWIDPRRAGRAITLTVSGLILRAADAASKEPRPLTLPVIRLEGVAEQKTQLTVQARENWRLRPTDTGPFLAFPDTDLPGVRWAGHSNTPGAATFIVSAPTGQTAGDILTLIETSGRQYVYRSTLLLQVPPGAVQTLTVDVRRAESDRPQLQVPAGVRLRETRSSSAGTTWTIDCLPGAHAVIVLGRIAAGAGQPVPAPDLIVRGTGSSISVRRWLALGAGGRAVETTGLRSSPLPEPWRTEIPSNVPSWAIADDRWEMTISRGPKDDRLSHGLAVGTVTASSEAHGRWLMKLTALAVADLGERSVRMPADCELLEARFEQGTLPVLPLQERCSLPREPALFTLCLVWRTRDLGPRPLFELPRLLVGTQPLPWSGVGWVVLNASGGPLVLDGGISAARADLHAADDLDNLASQSKSRLSLAELGRIRSQINASLRRAELRLGGPANTEPGPGGEAMVDWLGRLRAASPDNESPGNSPPEGTYADAFERGSPHRWHSADGSAPTVRLNDDSADRQFRIGVSAALILVVLAGALVTLRRPDRPMHHPGGSSLGRLPQ